MAHSKIRVPLLSLAFAGAVGCAGESTSTPARTPADQATTTGAITPIEAPATPIGDDASLPGPAARGDTGTLDDGQIVAAIQAADLGEIAQARVAFRKSTHDRVKHFAEHMLTDHSAAEATLSRLDSAAGITPQESPMTSELRSGAEAIMSDLKSSGSDFDKVYIDAQISEHAQVLALLDDTLIPHAKNVELATILQAVRAKVAGHLEMARAIQSTIAHAN